VECGAVVRPNLKANAVSGDCLFCARQDCFKHLLKERHGWLVPAHCISKFVDPLVFCINFLFDLCWFGHFRS